MTFCYNFRQKGVKLNSSHFSCASVSSLPPGKQHSTPHKTRCKIFLFHYTVNMLRGKEQMTNLTNNKAVLSWIDEMTAITKPDKIVWITGEEEQLDELREQAVREGILIKLNPDKLPGCYLHRTDPDDVARVEDRTFICCEKEEDAGPTNHWVEPKEMYEKMYALADGAYKGRTMYIIPYSMSIIGSPFAKYGFELTDSIYVVLNMHIMTRIGKAVCDALGDDEGFIKGLHCQCNLDKDNKYIVHFPQDNTIISMNSNYGGNVLQGKKCFALRIASNLGRQEGWMAEHMLILGIQNPRGEIKYISAAFPSACGKTNLAMLIPPEGLQRWGWRVWCVGDDIAWLRVGKDGRLWAVNPENGFFGVAPGTSMKSNPNALISTHKDTIFTNVALDLSDNTVWWEGLNKTPPARAIDWRGRPWTPQSPEKAAHPNSRFTAPARNCPCLSPEFDNPEGVPISAIVFGGRRAKTAPLVYQSFNWQHGVFIGSIMASETTAAATGRVGVVRRDPMAMLPFCGYNMADYWSHWLEMKRLVPNAPMIFRVNWFRKDEAGHFMWPGYGENMRVLQWIINRVHGRVGAVEGPVGLMPRYEDLDLTGLNIDKDAFKALMAIDKAEGLKDTEDQAKYFRPFADQQRLPAEFPEELKLLSLRFERSDEVWEPV